MNMINKSIQWTTRALSIMMIMVLVTISVLLPTSIVAQPSGQPSNVTGPDLEIINITFSDDDPMEGDIIVLSTVIKNNGFPVQNLTVSFLLNNEPLHNVTDVTLGANDTKSIEYEWTTEKGTQIIGIRLYLNGNPMQIPMVTESIYVEQEPIGDIETLIYAILVIFIFVLILVILPSIWTAVQPEIKPYEHLKKFQKP